MAVYATYVVRKCMGKKAYKVSRVYRRVICTCCVKVLLERKLYVARRQVCVYARRHAKGRHAATCLSVHRDAFLLQTTVPMILSQLSHYHCHFCYNSCPIFIFCPFLHVS